MRGDVCARHRGSSPTWVPGFNIAMQDLDIRGAGGLLGAEAERFVADMAVRDLPEDRLNEAITELRARGAGGRGPQRNEPSSRWSTGCTGWDNARDGRSTWRPSCRTAT